MAQATTLSSVGVSAPIGLNPVSKTTVAQLTLSAASSLDVTIQATLDDATVTTPVWSAISTTHFSSTTLSTTDGVMITLLSPVAGLRISSSTNTATTLTLKVLQAVTA